MLYHIKKIALHLLLVFSIILINPAVFAQDYNKKAQLENEKDRLEKAITYTGELLSETRFSKETTLNDLTILENKISKREKLITTYKAEIEIIKDEIFAKLIELNRMLEEIEKLKDEYSQMIFCAYKNRNFYRRMLYIVAADDFNQAYKRLNYFRQYATQRKKQLELIQKSEKDYIEKIKNLEQKIGENEILLAELENEMLFLNEEKTLKKEIIFNLSEKENELAESQNTYQKNANELKIRIENIIAEELRKTDNKPDKKNKSLMSLTPEEKELSATFSSNQGKLPWPSERGIILSSFGEHEHPDLKGIKIRNNGINIITLKGASARAVFEGDVTRVISMPNFNNVVIIRHGEFLTVYSNLDKIFVKKGYKVRTKQEIGTIYTDEENSKTILHFEIWKGKTLLDPEIWLALDKSSGLLKISKR